MPVILEGGCRVTGMKEGPFVENGTLRIWSQIGRKSGAEAISLRVLEFAPGTSPGLRNEDCDEVLYLLEKDEEEAVRKGATPQTLSVFIDGWPFDVATQTGIYLAAGQTLTFQNHEDGPVNVISARCPDPAIVEFTVPLTSPINSSFEKPPFVRLADRPAQPTADRWYRVLVDEEVGSKQVTQFIGAIPPGRAPDHFHEYEEVLFILRGEGRMWAGASNTPIGAGSCVFLPKRQIHCVENTGKGELRLLGVFYPAGSPAVRYEV